MQPRVSRRTERRSKSSLVSREARVQSREYLQHKHYITAQKKDFQHGEFSTSWPNTSLPVSSKDAIHNSWFVTGHNEPPPKSAESAVIIVYLVILSGYMCLQSSSCHQRASLWQRKWGDIAKPHASFQRSPIRTAYMYMYP